MSSNQRLHVLDTATCQSREHEAETICDRHSQMLAELASRAPTTTPPALLRAWPEGAVSSLNALALFLYFKTPGKSEVSVSVNVCESGTENVYVCHSCRQGPRVEDQPYQEGYHYLYDRAIPV
ncbi:Uncharacterized protein DAT39_000264 [Clarias magur]|uniref:Uncharacterized protein n=1 Tax=Clarias magur TaxID=1594786 RepID=A0A8J4XHK8_CLAMG|nr:Uncharacterized protein DAT39_000264 [Clarias magur]